MAAVHLGPDPTALLLFWVWLGVAAFLVLVLIGTYVYEALGNSKRVPEASAQIDSDRTRLDRSSTAKTQGYESYTSAVGVRPQSIPSNGWVRQGSFSSVFTVDDTTIPASRFKGRSGSRSSLAEVALQFGLADKKHLPGRDTRNAETYEIGEGREALLLREAGLARPVARKSLEVLLSKQEEVKNLVGERDRIDLRFPHQPIRDEAGAIGGYELTSLDPSFLTDSRSGTHVRLLSDAFGDSKLSIDTRLELLRLLAQVLEALHLSRIIHGGVDAESFGYALDPARIVVLDYTESRVLGKAPWAGRASGRFLDGSRQVQTSFDQDRGNFAELAFQLLTGAAQEFQPDQSEEEVRHLVGPELARKLNWLWQRSVGGPGTRPTMAEWLLALN